MPKKAPKDDYYVLMWTNVVPVYSSGPEPAARAISRFRELGCNGGTAINTFICPEEYKAATRKLGLDANFKFATPRVGPEVYVDNKFPLYIENMCRSIYLGWGESKPLFREQYARFDRERDRSVFTRVPCVNDPVVTRQWTRWPRRATLRSCMTCVTSAVLPALFWRRIPVSARTACPACGSG
jgi:hypothetical protein